MHEEAFYRDVIGALRLSAQLEKRAAAGDSAALSRKAAHDFALLGRIKEALNWAEAKPLLQKGLLASGAATVPAVLGGSHLLSRAHREREMATEDLRNKALQVALGVGGIGAGLLGLHHVLAGQRAPAAALTPTTPPPAPPTPPAEPSMGMAPPELTAQEMGLTPEDMYALQSLSPEELQELFKQGSIDDGATLQKLAAVGYLDTVLAEVEKTASMQRDTHELRLINAEYGAQLLRELLGVA